LTDFAFNLGINALKNSTLRKKVNAGDWEGAKKEILKWNKAGGKVLSGLTKRRVSESILL
jgi:GH24 family phage-related lysozyme (muramidase)